MTAAGSAGLTSIIAEYDELVLEGRAPSPEEFCATHGGAPGLLARLRRLGQLHATLEHVLADGAAPSTAPPEIEGFRIVRPLGRGGMGRVFVAEQLSPRRHCALKLIDARRASAVERFRREADLAARLSHPGIATVYAFGVAGDQPYMASELVHGFSLDALLRVADLVSPDDPSTWVLDTVQWLSESELPSGRASGYAPVDAMLAIAVQVAQALEHAHERGVIHRDIKPANVVVGVDGTAKLIDFGIAQSAEEPGDPWTHAGTFVGSWAYAAPEQLLGNHERIGPWTDTYALGATLFEMLTQRTPFVAKSYAERLHQVEQHPPRRPRRINRRVSRHLDALVMRALHPDPDHRFLDGEEVTKALEACPTGPTVAGLSLRPLAELLPRRPATLLAWGVGLMAAFLLGTLWLIEVDRRRDVALHGELLDQRLDEERREHERFERRFHDEREQRLALETRYEAERLAISQALAERALRDHRPALNACAGGASAVLRAELEIAAGEVRYVSLGPATAQVSTATRSCVMRILEGLEVAAIGEVAPVSLELYVRLGDAAR